MGREELELWLEITLLRNPDREGNKEIDGQGKEMGSQKRCPKVETTHLWRGRIW